MTMSTLMERDMRGESETVRMLREDNNWLHSQLNLANMAKARAEADVARLRRVAGKRPFVPGGDEEFGYECGNPYCVADIRTSWDYCPYCGAPIDWRTWVDPETGDPDAYDRRFDR